MKYKGASGNWKGAARGIKGYHCLFFFLLSLCKTIQKWTNWQNLCCKFIVCKLQSLLPTLPPKPHLQVLPLIASDQHTSPTAFIGTAWNLKKGTTAANTCQMPLPLTSTATSHGEWVTMCDVQMPITAWMGKLKFLSANIIKFGNGPRKVL